MVVGRKKKKKRPKRQRKVERQACMAESQQVLKLKGGCRQNQVGAEWVLFSFKKRLSFYCVLYTTVSCIGLDFRIVFVLFFPLFLDMLWKLCLFSN